MAVTFHLVDVFADGAFTGNPLAVVIGAAGLDDAAMLRITRWLNFSETSFLLPPTDPGADYRVRIFTPERELPFAGHPTLGSCHAWLAAGGIPRDPALIIQQCGIGLVPVRRDGDSLAFAAPPLLRSGPIDAEKRAEITAFLGIDDSAIRAAAWADNGPGWVAVRLASAAAVLALAPARSHHRRIDLGVVGPHAPGGDAAFEIRAFFSDQHGAVREDPVTGSLNASIAQWLVADGIAAAPWVAAQGTAIGHRGRVRIDQDSDAALWIGGVTRTLFMGTADIGG